MQKYPYDTSVEGEWGKSNCGGMATAATWKQNPQFDLDVRKETDVKIELTQYVQNENPVPIGFYVAKRHGNNKIGRILKFGRPQFVATSQFVAQQTVVVELKLSAKPCPYVVIPATPYTLHRGCFTLRVLSTVHPVSLSPIDPKNDWKYCSVRGRWGQNSSGGCRHHSSWRKNPQFMISVDTLTEMTISLQVHAQQGCSPPDCGFYVSRSHNPMRRTLTLLDNDIVVKSRFSSAPDVSEELVLDPASSPFVLIAATREPRLQHEFTLSIFSDQPVRLDPIDTSNNSWKEVSVTANWRGANGIPPRFQLLLKDSAEKTTVLPLVSQPDSSDTLEFIGVSLKGRDENTVTESEVRASWEVATEASLKPEDGPFIIEPSVKDPQAQGSFSLTVFSDKEIVVAPEIVRQ